MRIADPGDRVHRLTGRKMIERLALATAQIDQRGRLQTKSETVVAIVGGTVEQHAVDALQALDRLTQRPGRQAAFVAEATGGVDQHQFQIPGQTVMLHAVIGENQIQRFAGEQGFDGGAAIGVDHQRHAGALDDQQRFVAGDVGGLVGLDPPRQLRRLGTVTTADHADAQTAAPAVFDQPEDHRRLAGTADGDVADHDQRHRRLIDFAFTVKKALAFIDHHAAIQHFQRPQQRQGRVPLIPRGEQAIGQAHQDLGAASTVVMRRWLKPSLPAASMAVITD